MFGRCPRWGYLLSIALFNLAIWLGLAIVVAVLGDGSVNLGVETLVRRGQATAAAYLRLTPLPDLPATADSLAALSVQGPAGTDIALSELGETAEQLDSAVGVQTAGPYSGPSSPAGPAAGQTASAGVESTAAAYGFPPGSAPAAGPRTPEPPGSESGPAPIAGAPEATPRAVVLADPAFDRLTQTGSLVERAVAGQRVEIQYDEQTLNREIGALLARFGDLPYRNVHVSLDPGLTVVTADIKVLGVSVGVELLGTLAAQDCAPRLNLQTLSVGGVLTPRFIKDQASRIAVDALNWYPPDSPICVDAVRVSHGSVTVYGVRR